MPIFRYLKKIEYLDSLIRKKATGSQIEFAKKVNLSRSTLNEYLKEMKNLGFPIKYCKHRKSYYYTEEGGITKSLFQSSLNREQMKEKNGGFSGINLESDYIALVLLNFTESY
jgi:predicted transcriptional regulator